MQLHWIPSKINVPDLPKNNQSCVLGLAEMESTSLAAAYVVLWFKFLTKTTLNLCLVLPLHYLGFFPHLFSFIKLCLSWPISFYLSYFAFPILSLSYWWKMRQWLDECVASEWGELTTGVLDGTQSSQKLRSCFYYM